MTSRILMSLAIALLAAASAQAQYYGGFGYGGYHASTYEEGVMNGFGNAVQGMGQANLYNSAAAKNYEEARSMDYDNRLKWTDTYFQMREKNRQYQAAERGPRATTQELNQLAHDAAPDRLKPTQLDPLSGTINWPTFLRGPEYAAWRNELDKIYVMRSQSQGGISSQSLLDAMKLVEGMQSELKKHVMEYPPQAYAQTKKFLQGLQNELRFPAG